MSPNIFNSIPMAVLPMSQIVRILVSNVSNQSGTTGFAPQGGYYISLHWHSNGESWEEVEEAVMKICRFSGKVLDAGKQLL